MYKKTNPMLKLASKQTTKKHKNSKPKKRKIPDYGKYHPDRKTIYLGGLSFKVSEKELTCYFNQFGHVFMTLIKRRTTKRKRNSLGRPLGHGLAVVSNMAYERILSCEHFLKGNKIDCKPFQWGNQREKLANQVKSRTLEIKNVPISAKESELAEYFHQYGQIDNFYLLKQFNHRKETNTFKKAVLIFKTEEAALRVVLLAEKRPFYFHSSELKITRKLDTIKNGLKVNKKRSKNLSKCCYNNKNGNFFGKEKNQISFQEEKFQLIKEQAQNNFCQNENYSFKFPEKAHQKFKNPANNQRANQNFNRDSSLDFIEHKKNQSPFNLSNSSPKKNSNFSLKKNSKKIDHEIAPGMALYISKPSEEPHHHRSENLRMNFGPQKWVFLRKRDNLPMFTKFFY